MKLAASQQSSELKVRSPIAPWGGIKQQGIHLKCGLTVLEFHLLCSGLHTQLSVWRGHEAVLAFAIESVAEAVERYEMRISEDDTCEASRSKVLMCLRQLIF